MSDYTLLIANGSPAVEFDVLKDNFELNLQANWQGTLACDINLDNAATRITARSEFILQKDSVDWFGGVITQTPEQGLGGPNLDQIVMHLSGVGYETYLTYRYVTETIAAGTTLKAALQVLDDYLPTGVTLDPAQVTGPTLANDYVFTRTRLDECLQALSAETGYLARITPGKLFGMYNPTGASAPFDILDTGPTGPGDGTLYQIGDLRVERTLDDNYANRIIGEVRGAGSATSTETFVAADGVTGGGEIRFTAKYPASQSINDTYPNVLYIDGVAQSVIGWGPAQLTGLDWYWDFEATPTAQLVYPIAGGRPFPTGAEVVQITYAIGFPFYVEGNDTADQALHPIKEALVSIDEAMTLDAAQAYVDAEATRRAATIERALYTTKHMDLEPGMVQTINIADRDINASCLITECRFYSTPDRPGEELLCDVTAVVGTKEAGNVRTTYKDWLKQGGTGAARTGVSGGAVAPPLRSVQFNNDGAFGGSEFILADPDRAGDTYGVGPDQHTLAVGVNSGTAGILALFNKTAGKDKALCFTVSNTGVVEISKANAAQALNLTNYDGDINLSAQNIGFTVDDKATEYIRLIGLAESQGLMPICRRVTSNYTVDSTIGSGGTLDFAIFANGTLTVTLPALTSSTILAGSVYRRCLLVRNVGTGIVTIDADSSETIDGALTVALHPGRAIFLQALTGTDAGWYSIGTNSAGLQSKTVTLTDAQIKALPTTPITIVSAPGSGYVVNYLGASWVSNFASVYTNVSATGYAFMAWAGAESPGLASSYVPNDSGLSLTQYSDLFESTTRKAVYLPPYTNTESAWGNISTVVARTARENQAMCIAAAQAGSDFTGGNASNTLAVTVFYTVEAI